MRKEKRREGRRREELLFFPKVRRKLFVLNNTCFLFSSLLFFSLLTKTPRYTLLLFYLLFSLRENNNSKMPHPFVFRSFLSKSWFWYHYKASKSQTIWKLVERPIIIHISIRTYLHAFLTCLILTSFYRSALVDESLFSLWFATKSLRSTITSTKFSAWQFGFVY